MLLLLSVALASPLSEGDLVFHRSTSAQSAAIAGATGSQLTHVGVVVEQADQLWVFEAVQPVRLTPLADWVRHGVPGTLRAKRLPGLQAEQLTAMRELGTGWLGLDYDAQFSWTDDRLYCSELVYKLFERGAGVALGELRPIGSYDLEAPGVREAGEARYGTIPVDRLVITPADVFADPRLVDVDVQG